MGEGRKTQGKMVVNKIDMVGRQSHVMWALLCQVGPVMSYRPSKSGCGHYEIPIMTVIKI